MRRATFLHLSATLLIALFLAPLAKAEEPKKLRVLFIGNSFTSYNKLPEVFASLAAHRKYAVAVGAQLAGGATLEKHWNDGKALEVLRQGKWDYVVLQEQSARPFADFPAMRKYATLFHEEIQKAGAKTALYMTWSYENEPQRHADLAKAYRHLGAEFKAIVVPVGDAWHAARDVKDLPTLYTPDHRHPNPAGTYLAACVFVRALCDADSLGLPAQLEHQGKPLMTLPADQAKQLQTIADKVKLSDK